MKVSAFLLLGIASGEEVYTPFNIKYTKDFTLTMKACFVGKLGNDFVKKNVNAMVDQYIDRFNDKYQLHSEKIRKKNKDVRSVNTIHNTVHQGYHYNIQRLSPSLSFEREQGKNIWSVKYTAKSTEGMVTSSSVINGEIRVRIGAKYLNKFGRTGGLPQFTIDLYQPDEFL